MTGLTSRLLILFLLIAFRLVLDFTYINFISKTFGYQFASVSFEHLIYFESWCLFLLGAVLVRPTFGRPSDFFVMTLFILVIAPMTSLYGLTEQSRLYFYTVVIAFFLVWIVPNTLRIRIPEIRNGSATAITLALLTTAILFVALSATGRLTEMNFDLTTVYEIRSRTDTLENFGIFRYLSASVAKVSTVFLLAYALLKKRYHYCVPLILLQFALFGMLQHKSFIFYLLVPIAVFALRRSKLVHIWAVLGFLIILFFGYLDYFITGDILLNSLILRRVFFVPAALNFEYFEFFSHHGLLHYGHSFLSNLVDYKYSLAPPNLIGRQLFGDSNMSANTGFLGSAYSNWGLVGVIVQSLLVGGVLVIIDGFASERRPSWFVIAVSFAAIHAMLVSSDFFTSFLTHGLLLVLLLLWLSVERHKGEDIRRIPVALASRST